MRLIALGLFLFGSVLAQARQTKDTIYFSNGGQLVGKLKTAKLGVVTFDPDDANDVTVQLRKLKTIAGGTRIFRIETVDHALYFGRILRHATLNMVVVAIDQDTVRIPLEDISILYPFERSLAQRFSGSAGLGYTYTRSSGFGRMNFDGSIKYVSRKDELSLSASGIYTLYDSLFSRDKEDLNLKNNWYFIRNWFATIFIAYQRNQELGLQRRFQEGLGLGNKFITSKHVYGWGRVGFVVNQEVSTENVSSGLLTEAYGQLEINVFRFEKPKINLLLTQTFYYSLTQAGRFRNDGSLSITWELFKDLNLSFNPYNNYDNQPPVAGSNHFDFGLVFGINYIF